MANPNVLDIKVRQQMIRVIKSEGNKERKEESLKRFEIFQGRQDKYIIEKLEDEFDKDAVLQMRKVTSINTSNRIIKSMASIYSEPPDRDFSNASDIELEQIENLYRFAKADQKNRLANEYFKLNNDQVVYQIIPRSGVIQMVPLLPHNFDVFPDATDPSKAFCYVLNVFDKYDHLRDLNSPAFKSKLRGTSTTVEPDGMNQIHAESEDYKALTDRFIFWTDEWHFITDGKGNLVSEANEDGEIEVLNPISRLPFIDVSAEKDNEFFRRYGSADTDFAVEFGAALSDLVNTVKLQSYAQAVMISEEQPTYLTSGPMSLLWLKQSSDPNKKDPSFGFETPGPDLTGGLSVLEAMLRIYLTARGLPADEVSGQASGQTATSGIERLLNMIDKFEASREDISYFWNAEQEIFDILRLWSNEFQDVEGEKALIPELNIASLNEDINIQVNFAKPEMIQTRSDLEDSVIKRMKEGLISEVDAFMELYDIDEDTAKERIEVINQEKQERAAAFQLAGPPIEEEQDDGETEDNQEQGGTED